LKKYGIFNYKFVDVLDNNVLRDQVKIYSKWPTFPQLFINGELIGGSDILHEMHKDHSLLQLLKDKELV
jgi:monothiol glutaredoxin